LLFQKIANKEQVGIAGPDGNAAGHSGGADEPRAIPAM
jgi:hypothetical protein